MIYGKVKSGKFHPEKRLLEELKRFEDKDVMIEVKRKKRLRSNQQNSYYWGVILEYFCQGYKELNSERLSKEEAHDFLKHRFNYREIINEATGEIDRIGLTTTNLSTIEAEEYYENC